ncbi:gastric inhibitory polypeptide receptor isoform X13 [Mesocricetus auratus]|uniref:Gastric inhibitory polypeptide receptor isoform X13 n=1 Tax=Mesocricetus auratus TaxID=10036 RepID=A0ABM2WPT7_MESAU|nr:gastric inhibitory polypeptide receptor isoform X13 [Mesocricetus auratus]
MPLRPRLLLLCLWGLLLQQAETDSEGQTTGELYQRWERYARECEETLTAADPPSGMVCNGSFDMYVCWDYTAANTTAQASCPWYLPWYRHVAAGYVFRQCGSDGQWGPWRDHTQCENPEKNGAFQDQRLILERLQVVYTVGYSLSLGTLLLALLILSLFRRLHCTRNYIHMNVFLSFMLRAVAILTRDRLLPTLGPYPGDRTLTLRNQALAACRTAQIVTQYCVGANYTWLLVEGVYLHHLLVIVGGSEKGHFRCYLLLGWGAPALFVIPWVIVRYLLENTQCWERNEVKAIWWIIRTPILITILVGPASPPPGCAQGFPILGKWSASLLSHPRTEQLLAQSLSPHRSISSSSSASLASLCQNSGRGRCAARTTDCGISGERALLLHQQRGAVGDPPELAPPRPASQPPG